jgi:histidinol-phosphatase
MFEDELAFANELADEAGRIGSSLFGTDLDVRLKPDQTPVTEADEAIEAMIRERVASRFPTDAVLGEEGGRQGIGEGGRCWIVDPIDGTQNFADGVQVWGTLIAFAVADERVVGVVNAPALGERYEAAKGSGARLNGRPIRVSSADRLSRSLVVYADVADWLGSPHESAFREMVMEARRDRGFGDFWGHMLVARGSADVMLEPDLAIWDWAALEVIVTEAGGRVTTFEGGPPVDKGSLVSTNGVLHDEVVARLRPVERPRY